MLFNNEFLNTFLSSTIKKLTVDFLLTGSLPADALTIIQLVHTVGSECVNIQFGNGGFKLFAIQ